MAGDRVTIEVIRPPGYDRFGDPIPGDPGGFEIPGCLWAPGPSSEQLFHASQVESAGVVYAPPGFPKVLPTDRVRLLGEVYEVDGKPQDWGSEGVVIALRQVTG